MTLGEQKMDLRDEVPGETDDQFRKRVEAFYAYEFKDGERWVLFDDLLVVAHPDRAPILVHEGGRIERFDPSAAQRAP